MARKRPLPSEDPPQLSEEEESEAESDSDDEEAESDFDEEEAESDSNDEDNKEEQKTPTQPKSCPPSPPPPPQRKSQGRSSSTEYETDESESCRYTVKPMEKIETRSAKKQRPEPSSLKQPSAKRKVQVEDSKNSKKEKNDVAENESLQKSGKEPKKPAFQKIWDDNDEIVLLQGMIDFREKKGTDPSANTRAFYRYVKKLLGQEFTDSQLENKIWVLKKKYNTNEGKGKDGENRAFSKPHDQKVFKLSKKIWGANKNSNAGASAKQMPMPKADGTAKKSKTAAINKVVPTPGLKLEKSPDRPKENGKQIPAEHIDTLSMLSYDKMLGIGLDEDFFKKGWEMVDVSKKEEFKQRWRNLQLTEMLVVSERASLIRDQTNLVLEAVGK